MVSSVAPGGSRALPLTCWDADGRPRPVEIEIVTEPSGGALATVNHATSTVRYTPGSFTGTTTLTYRATDGEDWSNVASHEIRVTAAQQAPVCDPTPAEVIDGREWTSPWYFPCLDPDEGDAVSIAVVDPQPAHGNATTYGSQLDYDAGPYRGADAITVQATDGVRTSPATTIPVTVVDATKPECEPRGTIVVRTGTIKRLDLRCATNQAAWWPWDSFEEVEPPLHGTWRSTWYGLGYEPDPGYTGTDRAMLRPVASEFNVGDPVELQFSVSDTANEPPECVSWAPRPVRPGRETIGVACTDADDDPVTLTITDAPDKGTYAPAANAGDFGRYTPRAGMSGADSITVVPNDGRVSGDPVTARFEIIAAGVNHAPLCVGQAFPATQGREVPVGPPCSGDEEGDTFTPTFGSPSHGTLVQDGAAFSWRYTAALGFTGADEFPMTASDASATSVAATTRMLVRAATAPVCKQAAPQTVRTGARGYVDLTCTDDDGMPLPTVTDPPDHGDIVYENQGWFGYQSDPGYEGADAFTVEAQNAQGTVTRTQQLTVDEDYNTAPLCYLEPEVYTRQQPVEIDGYCWDGEQDNATFAISAQPDHGELTGFNPAAGTVTYTPDAGYVGRDSFALTGTDERGAVSAPAVQKIVVRDATRNLAPSCTGTETWLEKGESTPIPPLCSDPDGDPLTLTFDDGPEHGEVAQTTGGWLLYTADADFVGADTFTLTASDGTLSSTRVTLTMNVVGEQGTPTCSPVAFAATTAVARTVDLPCEPWTPGSSGLTIDVVSPPQHGHLSAVTAGGKVTYTSDPGYEGPDAFTFRAVQGTAVSSTVQADITVTKADITKPPPDDDRASGAGGGSAGPGALPVQPAGTLVTAGAGLAQLPTVASSLSPAQLARRALRRSVRRGLRLGAVTAYVPGGRLTVRGRSTTLVALTCSAPSCAVTVRPRLQVRGGRRIGLRAQRLRFGSDRAVVVSLRLTRAQLRTLRRARRATVRLGISSGKRSGTLRLPVSTPR